MSVADSGSNKAQGIKTLGIRLEGDRHAKLTLVAQLRGNSINDEVQDAIDAHIAAITSDPAWASKADSVLADIEREAAARRNAFASLFGSTEQEEADTDPAVAVAPIKESRGRRSSTSSNPASS